MGPIKKLKDMVAKSSKPSSEEFLANGIIAVLQYNSHCMECPFELKKCCKSMNGVLEAELDKEKAEITVKGVFDVEKLKKYIRRKVDKVVTILKVEKVAEAEAAAEELYVAAAEHILEEEEEEGEIRTAERGETSHS